MKLKTFNLLIFLLSHAFLVCSQTQFEPGYVFNNQGDTIKGFIKNKFELFKTTTSWHKARIKCLVIIINGMIKFQTVSYVKLAQGFNPKVEHESSLRRVQRFFAEFKKVIDDLGMQIISSHTMVEAKGITMDNAQKMADDHASVGVKYCVQPWINSDDRNIEKYKKMIADLNKVGEIMKGVGIQFAYHNHNFEFLPIDGIVPYFDIFLKEMDAELITMELDMYWVTKAGHDPIGLFRKYPGRFQLFHFKDATTKNEPYFDVVKNDITSVGSGYIDFKRIYAARKTAGMKYFFVEDDNQGNGKPFKGIETSIENINLMI